MLPIHFLDVVEELTRLDPVRTYASRSAVCIARLVDAGHGELNIEGDDAPASDDSNGDGNGDSHGDSSGNGKRNRMTIALRAGGRIVGTLHLDAPRNRARFGKEDMRLAKWAARIAARHVVYAERLRDAGKRGGRESVDQLLARSPLTPRERDVVGLLVAGASTKKIAHHTGLTVATVHTYLKRIYPKLGVHSRVELVARMAGTGLALDGQPRALR